MWKTSQLAKQYDLYRETRSRWRAIGPLVQQDYINLLIYYSFTCRNGLVTYISTSHNLTKVICVHTIARVIFMCVCESGESKPAKRKNHIQALDENVPDQSRISRIRAFSGPLKLTFFNLLHFDQNAKQ